MTVVEGVTIFALIAGPVIAVGITLWHQRRTEKRAAKDRLFLTLMAYRKSGPTPDWINALNLIDVVFGDRPKVVSKWHTGYDVLNERPFNIQKFNHLYIELLSLMATSLGYKSLQQTDIDKFYTPQAIGDQAALNAEVQKEWLRVLKATHSIPINPQRDADTQERA
jgi:hypothetical protein